MNPADVAQSALPVSADLSILTLFLQAHWVVKLVMMVRDKVSLIERFMTSIGVLLRRRGKFSRMRSNTTTVSFSE